MANASPLRPFSVGVHGIGDHARRTVLPAIDACEDLRLAGISTRNSDVRAAQCTQWSCPEWESLDDMLANADLDAVFIATPIGCHFSDGQKVLQAGRHLWSEKAFTAKISEANTIISLAEEKDLAVCVSLPPAYHVLSRMIKDLLQSEEIGAVRDMTAQFGFPHVDPSHSKYDAAAGGSALRDVGYYPVLMVAEWMDEFPRVIGAVVDTETGYRVDTGGGCLLAFESGATATAHWGYGRDYINEVRIVGESGTLIARPVFSKPGHLTPSLTLRRQNQDTEIVVPACDQFIEMLQSFTEASQASEIRNQQRNKALEHQRLLEQVADTANG